MKQTSNYGLKKPEGQDVVNIDDLNYNADILDTQLKSLSNNLDNQIKNLNSSKVDKVQGKQLSTEDYSTGEKQKLAGIAQGANNYVHPNDSSTRHVTDAEKSNWNNKADGGHSHDDRYYTEAKVNNALSTKANSVHAHDDRYYSEAEADSRFASKSHNHSITEITDFKDAIDNINRYSTFKTNKDENSIFVTVQVKRRNGTLYLTSVLSGGNSPRYTTRTVTEYDYNGTTVVKTIKYNLSYDADDNLISEVLQ